MAANQSRGDEAPFDPQETHRSLPSAPRALPRLRLFFVFLAGVAVLVAVAGAAAASMVVRTTALADGDDLVVTCPSSMISTAPNPTTFLIHCGPTSTPTPQKPAAPTAPPTSTQAPSPSLCPASLHDSYVTAGPDGRNYPTWHPARDPSGCSFGHEHGADPKTSRANNTMPAFGYAAAQMGMTEPHAGFKVFIMNAGDVVEGRIIPADYRVVLHMGTSGVKRYTEQFHSIQYDYIARDGTGRWAHVTGMGDTGSNAEVGSTCSQPRRGGRDFSTIGCNDAYEIWNGIRFQVIHPDDPYTGLTDSRVAMTFAAAAFDPVTTRDPTNNERVVYTQDYRGDPLGRTGIDPLSPDAYYQGCRREIYGGPNYWENEGRQLYYYTDALGFVQQGPGPGFILQAISASTSQTGEFFKIRQDFCGNGIRSPN